MKIIMIIVVAILSIEFTFRVGMNYGKQKYGKSAYKAGYEDGYGDGFTDGKCEGEKMKKIAQEIFEYNSDLLRKIERHMNRYERYE